MLNASTSLVPLAIFLSSQRRKPNDQVLAAQEVLSMTVWGRFQTFAQFPHIGRWAGKCAPSRVVPYPLHAIVRASKFVTFWSKTWRGSFGDTPGFDNLLDLVMGPGSDEERAAARTVLHKLVHSDPRSASFNATVRSDGLLASASGKELNEPMKADTISALATNCLDKLTNISSVLLGAPSENLP